MVTGARSEPTPETTGTGGLDCIERRLSVIGVIEPDPSYGSRLAEARLAQIDRINADLPQWQPFFAPVVLAGDDEHAVLVWTAVGRTADRTLAGIEVFRVVDGRITDVWNSPYATEPWA